MTKLICFLSVLISFSSFAQVPITNNTIITTWGDSFARAQYGQRQNFFILSHYVGMYPNFVISPRDHSRSGDSNLGMLTNRYPKYGIPEGGASYGTTNVLDFFYVSSNGGVDSNTMYGWFGDLVKAPYQSYNKNGVLTNDWPETTNLFSKVIIGDIAYQGSTGDPNSLHRNDGAQNVAVANGIPFVDSWNNTVAVVTNIYATNASGYWWPAQHPGNELQLLWALTTLHSLGEETNAFTAVCDWNSTTAPSQTNHCTVSSITQSGGTFSFTFHADRMGPGYYTPDASQTNDCTGAFGLMPALSNYVCEIIRITNCPAGTYSLTEDGVVVATNIPSTRLQSGINLFTDVTTGAMWNQKKQILGLMCDSVDINRTNCSEDFRPNGNTLIYKFESNADAQWPLATDVSSYIVTMRPFENEIISNDQLIHTAAIQTNHTLTITLSSPSASSYPLFFRTP